VDAVEIKENLKIIIVGSAHDPMPIPRSSYEPLFYMVKNSEFDLYDFVEEEGEGVINTNKVRRHRKPYDYSTLGDYDVLLDDTWYQGEVAFPTFFLNRENVSMPLHYSIKCFDRIMPSSIYFQVSKTSSQECRMVSRAMIPSYRANRSLGTCAFCNDLLFFLQDDYGDEFYKSVLRQHRTARCTRSEWYREIHGYQKMKERFSPNWSLILPAHYEISEKKFIIKGEQYPLRRLIFSHLYQLNPVELREELLAHVSLVVDDEKLCTNMVLKARSLYFYDGIRLYKHIASSVVNTDEVIKYVSGNVRRMRANIAEEVMENRNRHIRYVVSASSAEPVDFEQHVDPVYKAIQRKHRERDKREYVWKIKNQEQTL